MESEKNTKELTIECKTAQCEQKVLYQINNIKNKVLTDMAYKTYLKQLNHKAAE